MIWFGRHIGLGLGGLSNQLQNTLAPFFVVDSWIRTKKLWIPKDFKWIYFCILYEAIISNQMKLGSF